MKTQSIDLEDIKSFLDEKVERYNRPEFVDDDPIQIPKSFLRKEDIEIAGFFAATIAWGQRKTIIKNAQKMMDLLENSPFDFVMSHSENDLKALENFKHRTFNGQDFVEFVKSLKRIYQRYESMENAVFQCIEENNLQKGISNFKKLFFEETSLLRTQKHLSDPEKGSAAKRINMYFRWMVRKDNNGVDLGIWTKISPEMLSCPLDVHSGNVARALGLITRNQNDAKALQELDFHLRKFDPTDPVKYDFALFGLGVFENFS